MSCSLFILSKIEKEIKIDLQCPGPFGLDQDKAHSLARPETAGPGAHLSTYLHRFKSDIRGDYAKGL